MFVGCVYKCTCTYALLEVRSCMYACHICARGSGYGGKGHMCEWSQVVPLFVVNFTPD